MEASERMPAKSAKYRRVAYADPPYPGQGHRYPHRTEVNHPILIHHLVSDFDAWALSTSSPALRDLLPLCPRTARVAAWCKPFASTGWSRVRYSWEPVIFDTDRRGIAPGDRSRIWDSLLAPPSMGVKVGGLMNKTGGGAKPPAFVEWIADLLDLGPEDEWHDLFPGTGACSAIRQEMFAE